MGPEEKKGLLLIQETRGPNADRWRYEWPEFGLVSYLTYDDPDQAEDAAVARLAAWGRARGIPVDTEGEVGDL